MVNVCVWQEHQEVKQLPILDAFEFLPSDVGSLRRRPSADPRKLLLLNLLLNGCLELPLGVFLDCLGFTLALDPNYSLAAIQALIKSLCIPWRPSSLWE
jgi:hypothetical protein